MATKFDEGSQAIVFLDRRNNLAYKIFKSFRHPKCDAEDGFENKFNAYKRCVFNSEVEAYKLISKSEIAHYFPKYYSKTVIEKIFDENGKDISYQFLLDCCLTLDLIDGVFFKQDDMDIQQSVRDKGINLENDIFSKLNNISVSFYIDSSICCNENGIKIIDIAIKDFEEYRQLYFPLG